MSKTTLRYLAYFLLASGHLFTFVCAMEGKFNFDLAASAASRVNMTPAQYIDLVKEYLRTAEEELKTSRVGKLPKPFRAYSNRRPRFVSHDEAGPPKDYSSIIHDHPQTLVRYMRFTREERIRNRDLPMASINRR